jgi:ABC-type transport system involved in multi-copper enzyme maturation permease subunit
VNRPPHLRTILTIVRFTLVENAGRRHLWWMIGVAFTLATGLALVGTFFPLPGFTTLQTVELFASTPASYFVLVVLVVLGLGLMRAEIDSGVAALILSRPVTAAEYVLGRYLGNAVAVAASLAVLGGGAFLVVLAGGDADWKLLYHFLVLSWNACVFLALVGALGVLIGTVAAIAVGALSFYALGSGGTYLISGIVDAGAITGAAAVVLRLFVALAPHVLASPLSAGQETVIGDAVFVFPGPTLADFVWSATWLVGALLFTIVLVERREL